MGLESCVFFDDDSDTQRLRASLIEAGFASDCAKTLTTGCDAAKSGQFQVVVSTPQLRDGSWRRLTDVANRYDLHFEVVLWAHNFELREWAEALDSGAFDVVDAVYEQPRAIESTKCALWAAYLKGAELNPRAIRLHEVA